MTQIVASLHGGVKPIVMGTCLGSRCDLKLVSTRARTSLLCCAVCGGAGPG